MNSNAQIALARSRRAASFSRKGTVNGVVSGITYGINGAIIGGLWYWEWTNVYSYNYVDPADAASLAVMLIAPLVFMAFNDSFAAIYLTIYNVIQGRGKDLIQSLKTKPGKIMIICGIIGGPMAQGCYYIGFGTDAAGFAGPISALYCVFGVLLGRMILHQVMNKRIWAGVAICVAGAIIVGASGGMLNAGSTFYLGLMCFLIAAIGWGFEGTIAAYGTPMIDPKIAINIRFITSAIVSLGVFVGVFTLFPDTVYGISGADVFVSTITTGTVFLAMLSGSPARSPTCAGTGPTTWPASARGWPSTSPTRAGPRSSAC